MNDKLERESNEKKRKRRKPNPQVAFSVQEVAERYGFSVHTVYNWMWRDGLPFIRHGVGGKIWIRQSDVEKFINERYEP